MYSQDMFSGQTTDCLNATRRIDTQELPKTNDQKKAGKTLRFGKKLAVDAPGTTSLTAAKPSPSDTCSSDLKSAAFMKILHDVGGTSTPATSEHCLYQPDHMAKMKK
jgi:hypothetical protein